MARPVSTVWRRAASTANRCASARGSTCSPAVDSGRPACSWRRIATGPADWATTRSTLDAGTWGISPAGSPASSSALRQTRRSTVTSATSTASTSVGGSRSRRRRCEGTACRTSSRSSRTPSSRIRRAEPGALPSHLRNIVRDVGPTAAFALTFAYKRFVAYRRAPGFFVKSDANRYLMHYHGEQLPNAESSVSLTNERDALGMRKLRIDLRYTAADVDAVMRAHRLLDDHLRRHG